MDSKSTDVLAVLKLYELRSESLMRAARAWFFSEFAPQSGGEIVQLLLSGEPQSAFYRMVTSHWEMASACVNQGGIDEALFLTANTEHVVVFAKLQPFIAEIREIIGEPDYLSQLEMLVSRVPNGAEKIAKRQRLLAQWARSARSADEPQPAGE